jgi:hypothetical protein
LKTKGSWLNCLAGLEQTFSMKTHNSSDSFFLKTHLTFQTAVKVSGYSPQFLRRLLRYGKLADLTIGQVW